MSEPTHSEPGSHHPPRRQRAGLRSGLAALAAALVTSAASTASAQGDTARVQELVTEARDARDGGRYEESIRLLLSAFDIRPDPALLFNIAKVYETWGDCANVVRYYLRAADVAASGPIARPEVDEAVRQELRSLSCDGRPDLTVSLLEQAWTTFPEPGVQLNLAGHYSRLGRCEDARASYQKVIETTPPRGSLHNDAQIALAELDCQEAVEPPPLEPVAVGGPNVVAWSLIGVGAAGLLVGTAVEGYLQIEYDEQKRNERLFEMGMGDQFGEKAHEIADGIEGWQYVSIPTLVVGGVALTTGVTFWLLDIGGSADGEAGASSHLLPLVGPDQTVGLGWTMPLP